MLNYGQIVSNEETQREEEEEETKRNKIKLFCVK